MLAALPFTVPSTGIGCSFTVLNIARVNLEVRSWRGLEFAFCALHRVATQVVVERSSHFYQQENIKIHVLIVVLKIPIDYTAMMTIMPSGHYKYCINCHEKLGSRTEFGRWRPERFWSPRPTILIICPNTHKLCNTMGPLEQCTWYCSGVDVLHNCYLSLPTSELLSSHQPFPTHSISRGHFQPLQPWATIISVSLGYRPQKYSRYYSRYMTLTRPTA